MRYLAGLDASRVVLVHFIGHGLVGVGVGVGGD